MSGPRRDGGREGPPGKSGLLGMKGINGEPGLGNERTNRHCGKSRKKRFGDREKGESVKASQASVVPQTNREQCVWKSPSGTDNGKIKVNKLTG